MAKVLFVPIRPIDRRYKVASYEVYYAARMRGYLQWLSPMEGDPTEKKWNWNPWVGMGWKDGFDTLEEAQEFIRGLTEGWDREDAEVRQTMSSIREEGKCGEKSA